MGNPTSEKQKREERNEGEKYKEKLVLIHEFAKQHLSFYHSPNILACGCLQEIALGARPYRHAPHSNAIVAARGARGHAVRGDWGVQAVRVARRLGVADAVARVV